MPPGLGFEGNAIELLRPADLGALSFLGTAVVKPSSVFESVTMTTTADTQVQNEVVGAARRYVSGSGAVEVLDLYVERYTGSWFEFAGRQPDSTGQWVDPRPNELTIEDLLAPALLSAPLRPSAMVALLGLNSELTPLLLAVPPDTPLARADLCRSDTESWWPSAYEAYSTIRRVQHVGRTRASKILARKRPALLPVWDSRVSRALGLGRRDDWPIVQSVMQDEWVAGRLQEIRAAAHDASGRAASFSDLRILDIVVWMRAGGAADVGRHDLLLTA